MFFSANDPGSSFLLDGLRFQRPRCPLRAPQPAFQPHRQPGQQQEGNKHQGQQRRVRGRIQQQLANHQHASQAAQPFQPASGRQLAPVSRQKGQQRNAQQQGADGIASRADLARIKSIVARRALTLDEVRAPSEHYLFKPTGCPTTPRWTSASATQTHPMRVVDGALEITPLRAGDRFDIRYACGKDVATFPLHVGHLVEAN